MKKLLAVAVATAISAPAMADMTIYGTVAVDFISAESATTSSTDSQIQRDDVVFGMKGSSTTDGGLTVGAEIKTEGTFAEPTLAYLTVGNDMVTLSAGKIGNPANAAETAGFSDTAELGVFSGEIDNAAALTLSSNGFTASIGAFQNAAVNAVTDNDGFVAALGYAVDGFAFNYGYETSNGTQESTGLKASYTADAYSVAVYKADLDVAGTNDGDIDVFGVTGSYTMGATTISAILADQEEYTSATAKTNSDLTAVKVAHNLGGGLSAYAEYANTDADGTASDVDSYTAGMSFSF
ncbi:hypothetical protein XMD579_000863 [Marinobacterium sp. xm-d-579]|uniref:porin n=1 Tax=Marinobacterium sp. xm-d-579 TaxID=2497734 RepID=UPI00156894EC|nr:porin [Marinobacterium sp. xm-d-579]NRP36054.1 hypothetical protein [Marinobacterium sp. xm-d-579]